MLTPEQKQLIRAFPDYASSMFVFYEAGRGLLLNRDQIEQAYFVRNRWWLVKHGPEIAQRRRDLAIRKEMALAGGWRPESV